MIKALFADKLKIKSSVLADIYNIIKDDKITYVISSLVLNGEEKNGKISISLGRNDEFYFGENITFSGLLETPENLEDFPYQEYLKMKGVYSLLKRARVIHHEKANPSFYTYIFTFKRFIENTTGKVVPEPHASFLNGLLFGSKKVHF